jgi:hypothetical protein
MRTVAVVVVCAAAPATRARPTIEVFESILGNCFFEVL